MAGANATTECPQWYVRLCGLATGPFTTADLIAQVQNRRFRADTEVYSRFERQWRPLQEIGVFAAQVAAEKPLQARVDTGPFVFKPAPRRKRISWKEKRKKVFSRAMRAPKLQIAPDGSVSASPRFAPPAEHRTRTPLHDSAKPQAADQQDKAVAEKTATAAAAADTAAIQQQPGKLFPERPSLNTATTALPQAPQDPAFLALLEDFHNHSEKPPAYRHQPAAAPARGESPASAPLKEAAPATHTEPAPDRHQERQPSPQEAAAHNPVHSSPAAAAIPAGVVRLTADSDYDADDEATEHSNDRRLQVLLFAGFLILGLLFAGFSVYLINNRNISAPSLPTESVSRPAPPPAADNPVTVKIPPAPEVKVAPPRLDAPARPQR